METTQPLTGLGELQVGERLFLRMRNMNLHVITTLIIVLGLVLTLFCVVRVGTGHRHVRRYLELNRARGEDSGEQNGG